MSFLSVIYFWSFTAVLVAKAMYSAVFLSRVSEYFKKPCLGDTDKKARFVLFVPLLHEVGIVPALVAHFSDLIRNDPLATLVFVTTQREFIDSSSKHNTVEAISAALLNVETMMKERIVHIHYPRINKTLAEQLNYALEAYSSALSEADEKEIFYGFYNADSRTNPNVIKCIRHMLFEFPDRAIFQQSSAFFQNHRAFKGLTGWILRANALRQTRWTFLHEIPRYLKNKIGNISLVHVVTHGLFIRADVLKKAGYFPTDVFGEDLYLGFILRGLGDVVHPVPVLENSDSPTRIGSMLRQKYVWFWGPLGYVYFWNRFKRRFPSEWVRNRRLVIGTTVLGIMDALNWLLAGFAFVLYLSIGIKLGYSGIAFVLSLGYLWLTALVTVHIYHQQKDTKLFPRLTVWQSTVAVIIFPLIVFLHGLPAFVSIVTECSLRLFPRHYLRPKTEKR